MRRLTVRQALRGIAVVVCCVGMIATVPALIEAEDAVPGLLALDGMSVLDIAPLPAYVPTPSTNLGYLQKVEQGRKIILEQRTKAESDLAVAAASILARAEFLIRLNRLSQEVGTTLPKGASPAVELAARMVIKKHGPERLESVAKLHFKTTQAVLASTPSLNG